MDSDAALLAHPTSFLPPLIRLSSQSADDISNAMCKLRNLYWPQKPTTLPPKISLPKRSIARFIHDDSVPDSGYASAEEDTDEEDIEENMTHIADPRDDDLDVLRADSMERDFAMKWITGFISRSDVWIDLATTDKDRDNRANLLDEATSLLTGFMNDEDSDEQAEAILRSFTFASTNGSTIEVELNDAPLLDDDHTCVGLQSWGSSIRLGERLCATPEKFFLSPESARPLRILELGAGTGLLSIIAAKLLHTSSPVVIATDYHPDVLANLTTNVTRTLPGCPPAPIAVRMLDWENPIYSPPLDEPFDVILAADVVYHPDHARWIKGCVERLLARPNVKNPTGGVFWMIIAVRTTGRHEGLDNSVDDVFPHVSKSGTDGGLTLVVLDMEETEKLEGIGRADECGYKLFRIGWNAAA
ncbi:Protein-lysine N-methyltransferase EFM2 [Hypsizygus marmoreus]|uniref:Protein-lysine N-methyltransferase EFM2 n=1 Tax=Hypsizygus marmoreus TaxID=39966 RepID=A0A369JHZ5_HYPMA|nr:Protein-lysine N-methyltransferase EFM2 [Hypsizygus marmoreus]